MKKVNKFFFALLQLTWVIKRRAFKKKQKVFVLIEKNHFANFDSNKIRLERNWVFATNSTFLIPISLQPDNLNLWYFKLTLFNPTAFIVWNIKGLPHWVATILNLENQSLWQKLNSFVTIFRTKFFSTVCLNIDGNIENPI